MPLKPFAITKEAKKAAFLDDGVAFIAVGPCVLEI